MSYVTPPPMQQPAKKSNALLIILLIVGAGGCVIVAVLAAILFPVFSQARIAAQRTATMRQAKDISMALAMYAVDNGDHMPHLFATTMDLSMATASYAPPGVLDYVSKNPEGGEFLPNPRAQGLDINTVLYPGDSVIVYDSQAWPRDGGRVVGLFDTSARYIPGFTEGTMLDIETEKQD